MTTRFRRLVILGLISLGTSIGMAATRETTIELGSVTVSLGMPKQEVLKRLSTAGYKVIDSTSTTLVTVLDETLKHVYGVQFVSGQLSYADRSWSHSYADALEAVIKALGSLSDNGATACKLSHSPLSDPDSSTDRIFVKCGQRGVLMYRGKINGIEAYEVEEFIGIFSQ